ncbi:DUF917 domain-containing protein [Nocardioides sp. NPDC057772]|uniref:DUF917 domain-containing protein n=1 Tax=Nocardioides sp. NPDC057772 TaxID=3346245 RepID=UPI00366D05F1
MNEMSYDVLRMITAEHVDALASGATLLGSGGGGDVTLGSMLLRRMLLEDEGAAAVPVVGAEELAADALVVHAGVCGAPDVLAERLVDPDDCAQAVEAVVAQIGGRLAAVGVIEIGGLNALMGVVAAARLGVPVIDGDLMGRAFPRLDQATLTIAGHHIAPMAVVGPLGDTVVVTRSSAAAAQALMVSSAAAFGGAATLAMFPAAAGTLVDHGVRRSLSACVGLGRVFLSVDGDAPADVVAERIGGRLLCEGRVDQVRPRSGREPGSITLIDRRSGSVVRVDHMEEYLAVTIDGRTIVRAPEVIVALDHRARCPIRTDEIRFGQSVVLATLSALHPWPPEAVEAVGPVAFGLHLDEPVP